MSRKNRNKRQRSKAQLLVEYKERRFRAEMERLKADPTALIDAERLIAEWEMKVLDTNVVTSKPNVNETDDSDEEIAPADLNRLIGAHPDKDHFAGVTQSLPEPSKTAQSLLSVLFRLQEREGAIGDLIEKYRRKYQDSGKHKADLWLYVEIAQSIAPLLFRIAEKVGWLVLGEWIKRHIS